MADWDADSAQLEQNLRSVLETIQDDSRRRTIVSVQTARLWHTGILGGRFGVAAREVTTALAAF